MKSLAFSVPFCWSLICSFKKLQTIRLLFIPNYVEHEEIRLIARDAGVKPRHDIECYVGTITEVFPIQLGNITLDIAQRDGFTSVEECQGKLAELNGVKGDNADFRWGFVIRWKPVTQPAAEIIDAVNRMYSDAITRPQTSKKSKSSQKGKKTTGLEAFI